MDHEMNDPAFLDGAELVRGHAQVGHIVWEKMLGGRKKEREQAEKD